MVVGGELEQRVHGAHRPFGRAGSSERVDELNEESLRIRLRQGIEPRREHGVMRRSLVELVAVEGDVSE